LALFLVLFTARKGRSDNAITLLMLKSKDQKQARTGSGLLSPQQGLDVGRESFRLAGLGDVEINPHGVLCFFGVDQS